MAISRVKIDRGTIYTFPDSACVACIANSRYLALVGQFRPTHDRFTIELPGGVVEAGESSIVAAAREFEEETQIPAPPLRHLLTIDLDFSTTIHRTHVYYAFLEDPIPGPMSPNVNLVELPKAVSMVWSGEITHAPTVSSVLAITLRKEER